MWHNDLHSGNIFVNPQKPTEMVGIIDWQSVHLSPIFLQARHPALIDLDGPTPEGFSHIELPQNFDQLSADALIEAMKLRLLSALPLYTLYEIELYPRNKNIFRAAIPQDSSLCNYYNGWLAV